MLSGRVSLFLAALSAVSLASAARGDEKPPVPLEITEYQWRQGQAAEKWWAAAGGDAQVGGAAEAHALALMRATADATPADAAAALRGRIRERSLAFTNRHLNDLSHWLIEAGEWQTDRDGRIVGKG